MTDASPLPSRERSGEGRASTTLRSTPVFVTLLTLAACALPDAGPSGRWIGSVTPKTAGPLCTPTRGVLQMRGHLVKFEPNEGTWTLDGEAKPDGSLYADHATIGADKKTIPHHVRGDLDPHHRLRHLYDPALHLCRSPDAAFYLGTTAPVPPGLPGGGTIGITPAAGGLSTAASPAAGGAMTPLSGTGRPAFPPVTGGLSLRGRDSPPSFPGGIVAPPL